MSTRHAPYTRDLVLLVGFVVCVLVGLVTVLWPEVSSQGDPAPAQRSK